MTVIFFAVIIIITSVLSRSDLRRVLHVLV